MKYDQKIFIDGIETRRQIDELAGKKQGMKAFCESKGVHSETLSQYCRNGYGSPKVIEKYMRAGIPISLSSRPIPSRMKKAHKRNNKEDIKHGEQIGIESIFPEELKKAQIIEEAQLKDILIRGLQSIIEELKRI